MTLQARSPPARSLPASRGRGRGAVEFLPPFAVALLILPFVIQHGKFFPWEPSTIDLQVYVYAVRDMLAGKDILATTTPGWGLYFIYPPIAAILMTPLALGPYWFWQVVWTGGLVWAQQSVLKRCGAPRGWKLGIIGIAVVLAVEPIRTTLGYGQVNTILMALVIADLLPDSPGERRRIPQGILTGLAAAIKLTPALFVLFMFLIGKRRAAITAIISFVVFTAIGAIFLFRETVVFFGGLSGGDTRTASPLYAGNQSLLGVFYRLGDSSRTTTVLGLAIAGIVALLGALVSDLRGPRRRCMPATSRCSVSSTVWATHREPPRCSDWLSPGSSPCSVRWYPIYEDRVAAVCRQPVVARCLLPSGRLIANHHGARTGYRRDRRHARCAGS